MRQVRLAVPRAASLSRPRSIHPVTSGKRGTRSASEAGRSARSSRTQRQAEKTRPGVLQCTTAEFLPIRSIRPRSSPRPAIEQNRVHAAALKARDTKADEVSPICRCDLFPINARNTAHSQPIAMPQSASSRLPRSQISGAVEASRARPAGAAIAAAADTGSPRSALPRARRMVRTARRPRSPPTRNPISFCARRRNTAGATGK